jgi:hypothetical protein
MAASGATRDDIRHALTRAVLAHHRGLEKYFGLNRTHGATFLADVLQCAAEQREAA